MSKDRHWLDTVTDILAADTSDLRKLAVKAGGDPATFYNATDVSMLDLSNQDIDGMQFGNALSTRAPRTAIAIAGPFLPLSCDAGKAAEFAWNYNDNIFLGYAALIGSNSSVMDLDVRCGPFHHRLERIRIDLAALNSAAMKGPILEIEPTFRRQCKAMFDIVANSRCLVAYTAIEHRSKKSRSSVEKAKRAVAQLESESMLLFKSILDRYTKRTGSQSLAMYYVPSSAETWRPLLSEHGVHFLPLRHFGGNYPGSFAILIEVIADLMYHVVRYRRDKARYRIWKLYDDNFGALLDSLMVRESHIVSAVRD